MKKLSLKNLKLEANDMLQRDQLKSVFGGYGGYNGQGQGCCNTIEYDDGYIYTACNGSSPTACGALVGYTFTDSYGTATVIGCIC